ncbi:hypothetical protein BJ875DRAFT_234402 [Amylocarpus encephaloides]|uniref:RING-type domain-containing protein n=1 Tax=Amylocarpus encephaloides TaxID=45428 RepID=A0A9P7YMH9_9HELO|nr:hypothetical protein BJ875DRAFT_234402 [Amylocarpus encephaloides]
MNSWMDRTAPRPRFPNEWDNSDEDDDLEERFPDGHGGLEVEDDRTLSSLQTGIFGTKKVPSKTAIASLEVVKPEDLKDADKTCIICYNEFGVSNPEGLVERPLRLPKCKHIFGDGCIKKWFEDSDSCPYCRDKLPSELAISRTTALETLRSHRERIAHMAAVGYRSRHSFGGAPRFHLSEESGRTPATQYPQRAQDEYELEMNRTVGGWDHALSNRSSPGESNDNRRRPPRGRNGNNRAGHTFRPMSVGSARYLAPPMAPHPPLRAVPDGSPGGPISGNAARPSMMPALRGQGSGEATTTTTTTTSQTTPPRHRQSPSNSFSSSTEQPSPPVAVGSGENVRPRRSENLIDLMDGFTEARGENWTGTLGDSVAVPPDSPPSFPVNAGPPRNLPGNQSTYLPHFNDLGDPTTRFFRQHGLRETSPSPRWSH